MSEASLPRKLHGMLPGGVRRCVSRVRTYFRRMYYWVRVMREIKGIGPADRRTLLRSFLGGPLDSFRDIDNWRDPMAVRDAAVEVKGVGRYHVRAFCDDLYHVLPAREREILETIRERLRPGDTFVDAGANIGFYTVFASQLVGPQGRVVAVEMMPETAAMLRRNLALNEAENVTVIENALSDVAGQIVKASYTVGQFGQASIAAESAAEGKRVIEVPTATLADLLQDHAQVRVMKMDLEGEEIPALEGAGDLLNRIECVIFEDLDGSIRNCPIWAKYGFEIRSLDSRNLVAERRAPAAD